MLDVGVIVDLLWLDDFPFVDGSQRRWQIEPLLAVADQVPIDALRPFGFSLQQLILVYEIRNLVEQWFPDFLELLLHQVHLVVAVLMRVVSMFEHSFHLFLELVFEFSQLPSFERQVVELPFLLQFVGRQVLFDHHYFTVMQGQLFAGHDVLVVQQVESACEVVVHAFDLPLEFANHAVDSVLEIREPLLEIQHVHIFVDQVLQPPVKSFGESAQIVDSDVV